MLPGDLRDADHALLKEVFTLVQALTDAHLTIACKTRCLSIPLILDFEIYMWPFSDIHIENSW